MKAIYTLAAFGLLAAGLAHADNRQGWYAGGAATHVDSGLGVAPDGDRLKFNGAEGYGGFKLNPYVGGELRIGTGLTTAEVTVASQKLEYSLTHYVAAYYRVESANQVAKLYGLAGLSQLNIDISGDNGGTFSGTESGFSYGFGIGFVTGLRTNLNFEYRRLMSNEDFAFDIVTVGVDFRF